MLSDARQAATGRRYDAAVADILDARDMVERDAATTFDDQQSAIEALLRTASNKSFDRYLGPSYQEELDGYAGELRSFDDAIEIAELRRVRDAVRDTCLAVVEELRDSSTRQSTRLRGQTCPTAGTSGRPRPRPASCRRYALVRISRRFARSSTRRPTACCRHWRRSSRKQAS
ncbi:hypothetical protein [Halovenus salina]|uniref:Uncharacterized protein n=1 Tax=Halovenus salina TaxID=1510225 RepID=A0ABD5W0I9_9EURY